MAVAVAHLLALLFPGQPAFFLATVILSALQDLLAFRAVLVSALCSDRLVVRGPLRERQTRRMLPHIPNRLVGLVERRPPRERKIPGSNPDCAGIFSESSHTSDSKIGTPVAPLPGAWRYRVSSGTGRPGVSIL